MQLELHPEDASLLEELLSEAFADVRVEIHHCRVHDYREQLKEREQRLAGLLERLKQLRP